MVEKLVVIEHYASGSALAYKQGKAYLMGDDMNYMIIMNNSLQVIDSILLEDSIKYKIAKDIKPDIEAATFTSPDSLLLLGSGSKKPFRNTAFVVNINSKQKTAFNLDTFYQRLENEGIEINIEGAAAFDDKILLSNRGNNAHPTNHLVITSAAFYKDQKNAAIKVVEIKNPSIEFSGVSGLEYSSEFDRLLLTVSTEDTYSTHEDGAIGKSYLWIINNISAKLNGRIKAEKIIDLATLDKRFIGQKIESVCIVSESINEMELMLVADNDNGNSTVFKLRLSL